MHNSSPNQGYLTFLRKILTDRFNESELRTLCFDLSIDYDDLSNEGRADRAREIVSYLYRRRGIAELVEFGKQIRPDIDWNEGFHSNSLSGRSDSIDSDGPENFELVEEQDKDLFIIDIGPIEISGIGDLKRRLSQIEEASNMEESMPSETSPNTVEPGPSHQPLSHETSNEVKNGSNEAPFMSDQYIIEFASKIQLYIEDGDEFVFRDRTAENAVEPL